MNFEKIVDISESFPSKQYKLALYELVDRYLIPRLQRLLKKTTSNTDYLGINKKNDNSVFNTGFKSFLSYSKRKNIPFTMYLHASRDEIKSGSYNQQGKEILSFAKENNVPIILGLENGTNLSDFRDGIHINSKGQKKIVTSIIKYMDTLPPVDNKGNIQ
jgi:hypothetical protein